MKETWAQAARAAASHNRDYLIEAIREMQSAHLVGRNLEADMSVPITENNKWANVHVDVLDENKIDLDISDDNGGKDIISLRLSFPEAKLLSHLLLSAVSDKTEAARGSVAFVEIINRIA